MTTATLTVREATLTDKDGICALALESWSDAPFRDVEPNVERIAQSAEWFLTSPDTGGWVLTDGEQIIGVLGLLLTCHLFTGQKLAIEWWLWIRPEARNGSGLMLIKSAEKWAKERGASAIQLIAPSPTFRSLCERLGYAPIEMLYQKEL